MSVSPNDAVDLWTYIFGFAVDANKSAPSEEEVLGRFQAGRQEGER